MLTPVGTHACKAPEDDVAVLLLQVGPVRRLVPQPCCSNKQQHRDSPEYVHDQEENPTSLNVVTNPVFRKSMMRGLARLVTWWVKLLPVGLPSPRVADYSIFHLSRCCTWESSRSWPKFLGPCTHVGDRRNSCVPQSWPV